MNRRRLKKFFKNHPMIRVRLISGGWKGTRQRIFGRSWGFYEMSISQDHVAYKREQGKTCSYKVEGGRLVIVKEHIDGYQGILYNMDKHHLKKRVYKYAMYLLHRCC